mgnify:CR=1 FL=1
MLRSEDLLIRSLPNRRGSRALDALSCSSVNSIPFRIIGYLSYNSLCGIVREEISVLAEAVGNRNASLTFAQIYDPEAIGKITSRDMILDTCISVCTGPTITKSY